MSPVSARQLPQNDSKTIARIAPDLRKGSVFIEG
jgi:hypothetical protein